MATNTDIAHKKGAPPSRGAWQNRLIALAVMVGVLWAVELVDWLAFGGSLDRHGIAPRSVAGLWGIALAPLLHGGFGHLAANSLPLFVLGLFLLMRGTRDFALATVVIWLLGGLGTWLTGGAHTVHIGASGVIFGYFGFLLAAGLFERSWKSIGIALVVGFLYGGMIWGVLPSNPGISWQGHLFGFLSGVLAAWLLTAQKRKQRKAAA